MNEITPAALSRMAGVSRARISTIMKADPPRLTIIEDDGKRKIDLDGHLTAKFLKGRSPKPDTKEPAKPKTGRPPTTSPEPPNPYQGDGKPPTGNNLSGLSGTDADTPEDGHGKTWHDIELKKQQIEEKRIKNEQQRGNLIEKPLIELLFGKMYQIDVDQIKTIGIELSPKLITVLNERNRTFSNEICEVFEEKDKEVKKHVESILNSGEKDIKTKIISICEDLASNILGNVRAEIDNFLKMMATDE